VIAGIAGVGENVQYSMEFCNMSGEAGREGDWNKEVDLDKFRKVFETWDPTLRELLKYPGHAKIWRLAYTTPDPDWVGKSGRVVLNAAACEGGECILARPLSSRWTSIPWIEVDCGYRERQWALKTVFHWQNASPGQPMRLRCQSASMRPKPSASLTPPKRRARPR
jgi:hypothetical protein